MSLSSNTQWQFKFQPSNNYNPTNTYILQNVIYFHFYCKMSRVWMSKNYWEVAVITDSTESEYLRALCK